MINNFDSKEKLATKYQKAGKLKYYKNSPCIDSWKCTVKKKKFQIKLVLIDMRLRLAAKFWFSDIFLTY
jgi:hypothetical protein